MPPKKAGKASKLARMSDEERARYLLHRANVEEEARRRKQQLICTFMKNKLKREEAFTRINLAKINQQWRQILRQTKVKELNQNVTLLWSSFERAVDRKNQIIDDMLTNLQQSEDQYSRNLQSHTETIDELIGLHESRLAELYASFSAERHELMANRYRERTNIAKSSRLAFEYLGTVKFAAATAERERGADFKGEQTINADDARNNTVTDVEKLSTEREGEMSALWQRFRKVLGDYLAATEQRRSQYVKLRARDDACSAEVYDCCRRVNRAYDRVAGLRAKLAACGDEQRTYVGDLMMERQQFVEYFWELRNKMMNDNRFDRHQITRMTVLSNDAITTLRRLEDKGEKLLQLSAVCRKLETKKEKVMPFGPEGLNPEEDNDLTWYEEPLAKKFLPYEKLKHFWRRYNLVHVERAALSIHHKALMEENRQLRAAVKHYLGSISHQGQMDPRLRTTPLRQYTAVVPTVQQDGWRGPRPITCIEASTSIAVQHMNRNRRSSVS